MLSRASFIGRLDNRGALFLTLFLTSIIIIGSPLKLQAQDGVGFYSPSSLPAGIKSFESLIAKWWDFRGNQPAKYANTWPSCLKADVVIANRSVVFLGDLASAPAGGRNVNATHQVCQISASQLLYLSVYEGECSQGENHLQTTQELLSCAEASNKVIKLMQVKFDGTDVSSNILRQSTSQPFVYTIKSSDNAFDIKQPCCAQAMGESYQLFFKPLPKGDHTITVEVIRAPLQPNQLVEHDLAKWDIKVVS
jgi:hypothetical protein